MIDRLTRLFVDKPGGQQREENGQKKKDISAKRAREGWNSQRCIGKI